MQIGETMVTEDVIYAEECRKKISGRLFFFIRNSAQVDKGYNSVRICEHMKKLGVNIFPLPNSSAFSTTAIWNALLFKVSQV